MTLPEEFVKYTKEVFGAERWDNYLSAFRGEPPVSIRLNPFKIKEIAPFSELKAKDVPWCRNAYYLTSRPNFTHDPLLHSGAYYVQEASSMFLDLVMRQYGSEIYNNEDSKTYRVLDLCAAPGGKSTLLRAALRDDVTLFSNEPDHRRANILMENIQKQGHGNVFVTNSYPKDYKKSGLLFNMILTDVPCSGEGMFRKDEGAIGEWSMQNVMKCAELQRSIVSDIWNCLMPGGLLVYSTCTFNLREDEENVKWIEEELGAEVLPVDVEDEWNITGSLLKGWERPVYRFIPGTTCGEGLFMAVLRKPFTSDAVNEKDSFDKAIKKLRVLYDGKPVGLQKGKDIIPAHSESLSLALDKNKYPQVELSLEEALRYLHHEALVLPSDTPRGFVVVTYHSLPLGFVKNIGNRANNLYPKEWKIRNL